jgi:hypothetical protein
MAVRAVHSVKAEMSVAMPKQQTKSSIDVDCVISALHGAHLRDRPDTHAAVIDRSRSEINRLNRAGAYLSVADVKVVLAGQALRLLTSSSPPPDARQGLADAWACADPLWHAQQCCAARAGRGVD